MITAIKDWAIVHRAKSKTLTWRVVASTDTFLLGWMIIVMNPDASGGELAGMIAGFEIATKMFLYWAHEKLWQGVPHVETKADTAYKGFREVDRGEVQAVHLNRVKEINVEMGAEK